MFLIKTFVFLCDIHRNFKLILKFYRGVYRPVFDVVATLQTHRQRSLPAPDYNTYIFTDNKKIFSF